MCIDVISIGKKWSCDKTQDRHYKPHKSCHVKRASKYMKTYDETNMQNILLKLMEQVKKASYPVVALIHDLGPTNL